ncbi:kinase-like domain-containing protein [Mycena sp. CBHHK59/15]|nr:kinase-like domain-containing protein [Mycena sp. CBHHK59/15]
MLHEAQVCEALMKSKHPNICEYFGYLCSEDGRMEGLCFKRHGKSLLDSVRDKEELDTAVVIKGISEGLKHLHSLHYAHNDVKPDNVVLDAQGNSVIIDFDSCRKIDESLRGKKAGTPGWSKEADVSEPGNGFYGLEKIVQWLQTPV